MVGGYRAVHRGAARRSVRWWPATIDDGKLIYAGRVGTGYTRTVAQDLWKRLHPLEIAKPPFDEIPPDEARRRDVRWVEPKTVIEVRFPRLDRDGLVRQAAFKGVREDKPATEVVRELPAERSAQERAGTAARCGRSRRQRRAKKSKPVKAAGRSAAQIAAATVRSRIGRSAVRFTHPDRVYWADAGVTKQDLADYYRAVWDWMAPHVVDRPLTPAALPRRHRGRMLLPEARLGRPQREASAHRHRQQAAAGHRGRGPRRAALAGAGGRARSARARLDDRPARSLRPHRVRYRSGRRMSAGPTSSRPRATCASGSRPSSSKAS